MKRNFYFGEITLYLVSLSEVRMHISPTMLNFVTLLCSNLKKSSAGVFVSVVTINLVQSLSHFCFKYQPTARYRPKLIQFCNGNVILK